MQLPREPELTTGEEPSPAQQAEMERLVTALREVYTEDGVLLYLRKLADKAQALADGAYF